MTNNTVILLGRFTRDPEIREGQDNTKIARFTLAVDRRFKDRNETDFISCTAFNKAAEFIEKYCFKGVKMLVRGNIRTGSYTNKDGQKVYTTEVFVEDMTFAESKSSRPQEEEEATDGYVEVPNGIDEELPFR